MTETCSVVDCVRPIFTKKSGLCQSHHKRGDRGPIRKLRSEEEKVAILRAAGFTPVGDYPRSKKPWLVRCNQGHEVPVLLERLDTNEQACKKCRHPNLLRTHPHLSEWWDQSANAGARLEDFSKGSEQKVVWKCPVGHSPVAAIYTMTTAKGPRCGVCSGRQTVKGQNDLASQRPEVAKLWDDEGNKLASDQVYYASMQSFSWRCSNGHTYERSPFDQHRSVLLGREGCPYCHNRATWRGFNDLEFVAPHLVADYLRGANPLSPSEICAFTAEKVTWQCEKKHEPWRAPVYRRTREGKGCSVCANVRTESGTNDALSANPSLAAIWAEAENGPIEILKAIPRSSARTFRWKCLAHPHTFSATVTNSVKGVSCAVCGGRELLSGFNDLESMGRGGELDVALTLERASEFGWTPEELDPRIIKRGDKRRVVWRCPTNSTHVWETVLAARITNGSGCPYCAGNTLSVGENDLETRFPELLIEWSPRNKKSPSEFSWSSKEAVLWLCLAGEGHPEYPATIKNRTGVNSTGCPDCNTGGFETSKPAYLYFIKHTDFQALKIGISNSDSRPNRLNVWKERGWEQISILEYEFGSAIRATEQDVLNRFIRGTLNLPAILSKEEMGGSGNKETFDWRPGVVEAVRKEIQEVFQRMVEEDLARRSVQ